MTRYERSAALRAKAIEVHHYHNRIDPCGGFHSKIRGTGSVEREKWKDVNPFYKNISKEGVVLWKAA